MKQKLLVLAIAASLVACGGSGGSDGNTDRGAVIDDGNVDGNPITPPAPVANALTGTAAAGAPIVGQVTIKDANGELRTVDIKTDGSYSVDVSGLTAPFLLRATGKVGGRGVTLVSAATEADVGNTINITPFTDLIVANIAGQVASAYFESGNFAALSADELNNSKTVLTQRLQPILSSLGIDESFDLLRTAFAANHSGFDAVMDVVKVTVDTNTGVAQIRDLINKTVIEDNLKDPLDNSVIPAPVVPLDGAVSQLVAIKSVFAAFAAHFAAGLPDPSSSTLQNLFHPDFLDYGLDLETFVHEITTDSEMIGVTFGGVSIAENIDSTTLRVASSISFKDGTSDSIEWVMKYVDGAWKIAGDQRALGINLESINARDTVGAFGNSSSEYSDFLFRRYLEVYGDEIPTDIDYVRVEGPGLANPVLISRTVSMWSFTVLTSDGADTGTSWIPECGWEQQYAPCIDFSKVGPDAVYTFEGLDADKQPVADKPAFTLTLPMPPLSNEEAKQKADALFATVTKVTPENYLSLQNGSTITVELKLPTQPGSSVDDVTYHSDSIRVDSESPNSDGKSFDMTWKGDAPTSAPYINVWVEDLYDRSFVTLSRHNQP